MVNDAARLSTPDEVARQVLDGISDAVLVCDDHGNLTYVCSNVRQIFGWTVAETFQRRTVEALLGPGLVQPELLAERGEIANIEREVVTRDGACRRLLITIRKVSIGNGTMLIVGRDVTRMRALEAQVLLQAQLLQSVRESVVATDLEGRVTYWGPGAARLYGWSEDEALGEHVGLIVEPDDREEEIARIEAVRTHGYWEGTYQQRNRDGDTFWAEARISLVRDANGQPAGLVGVDRDVTAFVELERSLRLTDRCLRLLDSPESTHAALDAVLAELIAFAACATGAIRLVDDGGAVIGEATVGWPATTCQAMLGGIAAVQCPCGLAFANGSGSFLGSSHSQTAELYPPEQRPRGCVLDRFESVAIVPVRRGGRPLALVYLADYAPARLTQGVVTTVERIGMVLAMLLEPPAAGAPVAPVAPEAPAMTELADAQPALVSFVQAVPLPAAVLDSSGALHRANAAFAEWLQVSPTDIEGMSLLSMLGPRQRLVLSDHLLAVSSGAEPISWQDQWSGTSAELCLASLDCGSRPALLLLTVKTDSDELAEQRRARAALQASLDGIPDPVWVKDRGGRLLVVNRALCRIWGRSHADLIGTQIGETVSPEHSERFAAEDRTVLEHSERVVVEERIVDAAGASEWYETVKSPVLDDAGRVIGTSGIARNISARRAAEIARREQEARLRRSESFVSGLAAAAKILIEASNEVPFQQVVEVLGAASRASRTYVFQIWTDDHGVVLASQIAEWCAPGITPQIDNPKLQRMRFDTLYARWVRLLASGEAVAGRVAEFPEVERPILQEQEILALLVLPLKVEDELVGLIGFDDCASEGGWDAAEREYLATAAHTLSTAIERQRARSQLEAAHNLLRRTFDEAPIGAAIVAPDLRIEQVNEELCAMLQQAPDELTGALWTDLIGAEDQSPLDDVVQHLISGRADHAQMESRMVRSNGDLMWGRVSLRLLRERGQPLRFIPMVEDITDWVIAREQLQDSEAQLRSLASEAALAEERERRRLASELHDNLGHELALAAIHLDSVVHQLEPASSEHRGDLESVRESVARAITSVRSLTFDLSPPELYQLGLRAALDSLAHRLNQRSGLDVQVQETGKSRELDDDLLAFCYTAVRELLVNVVKHAGVDAATVHIRWLEGQLVLSVVDQGAGFDSGSDADGGFGLLSMRERAHQLGGEMILLAAPGEGTRVTLSIPTQYPAGAQLSGGPEASWSGS